MIATGGRGLATEVVSVDSPTWPGAGVGAGVGVGLDAGAAADGRAAAKPKAEEHQPVLLQPATAKPAAVPSCVAEVQQAEPIVVDMYIMLDRSTSMLEETPTGQTKWQAMGAAFAAFLADDRSAGLNVSLQYYPLGKEGVPEACASDADCGALGPCRRKACLLPAGDERIIACNTDEECPGDDRRCDVLGRCSAAPHQICVGSANHACQRRGESFGECEPLVPECAGFASCDAETYRVPAVQVDQLPQQARRIVDSLEATQLLSTTPTGPALRGALSFAQERVLAAPGHEAVVVLSTDGAPTACAPDSAAGIADLIAEAFAASPGIATYVIGVFAESDTAGVQNSQRWARAGGTEEAFIVDPDQDVASQFLNALEEIRVGSVQCDYTLPKAPPGQTLDLGFVNVAFTEPGGNALDLLYVQDEAQCGDTAVGWHYDVVVGHGQAPSRIVLCPGICKKLKNQVGGRVEIQLGCETEAPI